MTDTAGLDKELGALHEDVVRSLDRIGGIIGASDELGVNWAGSQDDTRRAAQRIRKHAKSVARLELVMPIVAPMKAGKSTLINAIVGYTLLPARANPMTTLPTRIRLVDEMDIDKPRLQISNDTRALFDRMADEIRAKLKAGYTVPSAHSYLTGLADSIERKTAEPIRSTYIGAEEIRDILIRLNDQIRLAVFATGSSYASEIRELPEISTGYRRVVTRHVPAGGQLIIVDTPGPNEYAMAPELGPTLETQLQDSHVVLIVLDYTQIGSEAAVEVKDRLAPQLDIITRSKIIAVVNKVDERKSAKDLSTTQTRAAVREMLDLSDADAEAQVFETVARWGLVGAQMLADLERDGTKLNPLASESAKALMREIRPFDWENVLTGTSHADLRRDAEMVLGRSQMTDLLSEAIARLRSGAAPTAIESGIRIYQDALAKMSSVLTLELRSAESDAAQVLQELKVLTRQIEQLQTYRKAMPGVPELEKRFSHEMGQFVAQLHAQGLAVIDHVQASEANAGKEDQPAGRGRVAEPLRAVVRSGLRLVDSLFSDKSGSGDSYEFTTVAQAEEFRDKISRSVISKLEELLDVARRQLDKRATELTAAIVAEHDGKMRELVRGATERISKTFDVRLKVPPPAVVNGKLAVELSEPDEQRWSTEETYQAYERRRTWKKLWLGFEDVPVTRSRTVSHARYLVSRAGIANQLRSAFERNLRDLRSELDQYVAVELAGRLQAYYDGLEGYLASYHDALNRSHLGFEDSRAKQEERKQEITTLAANVGAEQAKLTSYLTRLQSYRGRLTADS